MNLVQLVHDKSLNVIKQKHLLKISDEDMLSLKHDVVVTFRKSENIKPNKVIKGINACSRFIHLFNQDVVLYHLEDDSSISPIIFWDIVHTLPRGANITVMEDDITDAYYLRPYYQKSLKIVEQKDGKIIFRKEAALPAELDGGLENWTFGIPVGPGDATGLNAVVKRILELDVAQKEIILCGMPGRNFAYWDKVRIVGTDIPAPPVQICRKKNAIVNYAKYNNICILHDRVFLPKDFYQAMKRYGDYFPFTTFQCIYFGDSWNRNFIRYSDYNSLMVGFPMHVKTCTVNKKISFTHDTADIFDENVRFIYANPCKYSIQNYVTGSLYIVKRAVWSQCPQNEKLVWEDFEDVEQGIRANVLGIPETVNPYTLTQSLYGRGIVLNMGINIFEDKKGNIKKTTNFFKCISGTKKPLFNIFVKDGIRDFKRFYTKYIDKAFAAKILQNINRELYFRIIIKSIALAQIHLSYLEIKNFIENFDRWILHGNMSKGEKNMWIEKFLVEGSDAKLEFIRWIKLAGMYATCPKNDVFCITLKKYFLNPSLGVKIGSLLTAYSLWRQNGNLFYNPDGIYGYYRAIINSTPFKTYL